MRPTTALSAFLLLCSACGDDTSGGEDLESSDSGPGATADSGGSGDTEEPPATDSTGDDPGSTGAESTGEDATGTTTTSGADQIPPTNGAELRPWLEAGEYLGWNAESGVHPSAGPHFGGVRTFVNDALLDSLDQGLAQHPMDAAAVKELYGDGDTIRGWSVTVKLQADSAAGSGWYWYEAYDESVFADGAGEGICTGCHGAGTDYVLSPFPLQ